MNRLSRLARRRDSMVVLLGCAALSLLTAEVASAQSASPVVWTNLVNATAAGETVQKTGGCGTCADAGATSTATIASGDGYAEFTPGAGTRLYVGLGLSSGASTDPALIDFAFSFWPDGGWDVRERSVYRAEGRFSAGDVFRVAVQSGVVRYYHNGALVHTSQAPAVWPLVVDTTLIGTGATLAGASMTAASAPASSPVAITTSSLPDATVGLAYSATLHASGGSGSYTWTVTAGALPMGLVLDPSTGAISGTAAATGRFRFTSLAVDAVDTASSDDQPLEIDVLAAAAPSTYDAIADRTVRTKAPAAALGRAGASFDDATFGTRMLRVTDGSTRPGLPGRSYRTPSGTHTNAWSADGRYFYAVSTDGTVIAFAFDAETMTAARVNPSATGDGGLTLRFFNEPTFSYVTPGVAYGTYNGSGANLHSIDQYDFETGQYTQILDLETVVTGPAGTYVGGLGSSAGTTERIMTFFGGAGQDRHFYIAVFDRNNPAERHLVDTAASTLDGQPTDTLLNFKIHAAAIDRSGRYVTIYPTGTDMQAPRSAAPAYVWDTVANTITATPLVETRSGGHDAYGYGYRVNQDCCTSSTWDAAQWQFRSLATPLATADLIAPVLLPKEVYLADHPSWHNAQPDRLVPFIDANYRYGTNTTEWRAWDEEIIGVQTDAAGSGATVWRFAHHHSVVANDGDPTRIYFWYTPRGNVSPDGRWALFTSNWEKTLGTDPGGEVGGTYRQDLFVVELKKTARVPAAPPVSITTTTLEAGVRGIFYSAGLSASGGQPPLTWSIASSTLPPGLFVNAATGVISGTPTNRGVWSFTVRALDSAALPSSDTQALSIQVRKR